MANVLHREFVNKGLFDHQKAAFFGDFLQKRIRDDYNELPIMDADNVHGLKNLLKDILGDVSFLIDAYFDADRTESKSE